MTLILQADPTKVFNTLGPSLYWALCNGVLTEEQARSVLIDEIVDTITVKVED